MIPIIFKDYTETKRIYHVVTLTDLKKTMDNGIRFDDKNTYKNKYFDFHSFIDKNKPVNIPDWVVRSKAIFGSLNFKSEHLWHSHSAILGIKIDETRCWVCNENIANFLYEPLILKDIKSFEDASGFIERNGKRIAQDYWTSSCSFSQNLIERRDRKRGYDAELLVLHDIPPEDIEILYIVSDHKYMEVKAWRDFFKKNNLIYSNC